MLGAAQSRRPVLQARRRRAQVARVRPGRAAASGRAVRGDFPEGCSARALAARGGPLSPDAGDEDPPEPPDPVLWKAGAAFELLVFPRAPAREERRTFSGKYRHTSKADTLSLGPPKAK